MTPSKIDCKSVRWGRGIEAKLERWQYSPEAYEPPIMRLAAIWASLAFFLTRYFNCSIDARHCAAFVTAPRHKRHTPTIAKPPELFLTGLNESLDVDKILNDEERDRLTSLVDQRANARARGDYEAADDLKQEIYDSMSIPKGTELKIRDISRKEGGGSTWTLVRNSSCIEPMSGQTVLQLAHAALGLAIAASSSEQSSMNHTSDLNTLVNQAKDRLQHRELVELELRGRKPADAAFWFALAGATDGELFDSLTEITGKEVNRYGMKPSCRAKDIWHVLERLAGAGVRSDDTVEQAAKRALKSKDDAQNTTGSLDFHSDRCLLMIWKFSTRQRKQKAFLHSALKHWQQQHAAVNGKSIASALATNNQRQQEEEWLHLYKNPRLPLVVDIGCGMGVSLLGLAQSEEDEHLNCNFAGVDLSGLAIGYARGLSHRWGLDDRLQFFVNDAESFMERVLYSYPGPIRLCLVQFPTPYRLQLPKGNLNSDNNVYKVDRNGNSQLPSDTTSGFMVTRRLLELVHTSLTRREAKSSLLIQSNCEDVAVYMRRVACEQVGFEYMDTSDEADDNEENTLESGSLKRMPKRALDWISLGGERAEGDGWSSRPILPRIGRTETEVACMMNGTPVYRCRLRVP